MRQLNRYPLRALAAAAMLTFSLATQAQLSTALIQGHVAQGSAPAAAGVAIVAVNVANGNTFRTVTRADGSYVLAGLTPGAYELRVGDEKTQRITVAVGETATVDLQLGGGQQIVITGALDRKDLRNSEIGTGVSKKLIDNLPQTTRNFLSFADLAPGVRFDTDATGVVTVRGGAQDQNNINIYIDGVSQKNNILRGGAGALDSSRGNPFPQSAVAEYKVISQNYKAEFDQVSSVAITAVTKSGTNEFHGDVFIDHTQDSWVAYNPIEQQNKAGGNDRAKFKQEQYGFTLGGPIKEDVAHFFVAYEGKNIATPRNVGFANSQPPIPNAGLAASFFGLQGSHDQQFKEDMLLAKFDLELGADSHLDATLRTRHETDHIAENASLSAPGNDKSRQVDENRFDVRHTLIRDTFVNEARLGYEDYEWHPHSAQNTPEVQYFISSTNLADNSKHDFLWTGGSPDAQDRKQTGTLLQDDFTYTGMAGHAIKTGAKVKFMEYNLSGTSRSVDIQQKLIDKTTGNIIGGLDPNNPGSDAFNVLGAIPATRVKYNNNQFGIYGQDDWRVTKQLELNLGMRWDYESNPLDNGYVTPAALVTALNAPDITRYGIAPAPGQTYAQSLAKGGININDFIATGSNRKSYTNAFAPRLGFSYDITGDQSSIVYGGWGRAYDRAMANYALDELQRSLTNGDQFMIRNNYKTPYSDQFSVGLRQAIGVWNGEIGFNYSHAKNQFNWIPGDRDPNGGWGNRGGSIDPNWGAGPQGYGMLILGDFVSQQKTSQLFLRADKPYTRASGWQAGVTYTYSDAKTTHRDWNDDIFNWGYGKPGDSGGYHRSRLVEKHRIVAVGVADGILPWGMTLSGKATIGSGLPYRITTCATSWDVCKSIEGTPAWTREVDAAVSKGIKVPGGELSLRLDVLNLFNTTNWTGYDEWGGGPGNPQNWTGGDNPTLGKATVVGLPMRTYKLSMRYVF
ncbi:MAG: TonB-dependent receptor [Burkholderiales bacterium]|nr:TonB-dependent receptor [Burkholderiales bacterium]